VVNNDRDIIAEIDEAIQHGPDAATWNAQPTSDADPWVKWDAVPGKMTALLLAMEGLEAVEISRDNPGEDIAKFVGDPLFGRMRHIGGVDFWVGNNSERTSTVNEGATKFLGDLLSDVVSGDYAASDVVRAHVQQLLASPQGAPVIHGPCLLTGVDEVGTHPGPLDESFRAWLRKTLYQVAQRRFEREIVRAALAQLGIPEDMIDRVTIVRL
jgi:hypothetical protein